MPVVEFRMINHRITHIFRKRTQNAEKLLLHTKNYSGTVCLTNLFKEGICRADTFILQTAGWKFYQNEFMPCDLKLGGKKIPA